MLNYTLKYVLIQFIYLYVYICMDTLSPVYMLQAYYEKVIRLFQIVVRTRFVNLP